jgi:hypothetical protein
LILETSLDTLIEPNTSFIAARMDGLTHNCLSNAFFGGEPGHPILARAIENALRSIYMGVIDERFVLAHTRSPETVEVWKLRAVGDVEEYAFGGCALGVAVNQVLESQSSVQDLELGRQPFAGGLVNILLVRSPMFYMYLVWASTRSSITMLCADNSVLFSLSLRFCCS